MRKILRRRLVDEGVGDELYMPTNTIPIPIIVNILIITAYVLIGAVVFSRWEDGWSMMTSAYFSLITLTTIGFGDYAPIESFSGIGKVDATAFDYIKMIFATVYCAVGKRDMYFKVCNKYSA